MEEKVLKLKSTVALDFYLNGVTQETKEVYLDIINISYAGYGDSMGANFKYYFIDENGNKVFLQTGGLTMDSESMNSTYDAIKSGIPADATYTDIQLYLNSTVGKLHFQSKFVGLNPDFTTDEIEVIE